jgi:hypothetical protein
MEFHPLVFGVALPQAAKVDPVAGHSAE